MKRFVLAGTTLFAFAAGVLGQTSDFWINNGFVLGPPQIDAFNVINNNYMGIFLTNGAFNIQLFDTSNTRNFTNSATGVMEGSPGFRFDTAPADLGLRKRAANFVNDGFINVGSFTNRLGAAQLGIFGETLGGTLILSPGLSEMVADATNLVNAGNINVGVDGLISLKGNNVDLTRGAISMEGFETNLFANLGIFDNYWGVGDNQRTQPFFQYDLQPPTTPIHTVTQLFNGFYFSFPTAFALPGASTYDSGYIPDSTGTNLSRKVVFLAETNSAISNNVFFFSAPEGNIAVEWLASYTNPITGTLFTNYLNLFDSLDSVTNLVVITNNINNFFASPYPTFIPTNFFFFRGGPLFPGIPPAPQTTPPAFPFQATNRYSAYSALFQPTTRVVTNVAGQAITNLPGRIEITADSVLNLDHTRIAGLNYLKLSSSNHFTGNEAANIVVPFSDIYLASTNGHLAITNLIQPNVPRFTGEVDLYAARWTNAADPGPQFNTIYHVLLVNSLLAPTSPSELQDLSLKADDITISDRMNVERGFLIDAISLTVTTNGPGATVPQGEINVFSTDIIWSSATPRLRYLTNNGSIFTFNAIHFGGARTSPYNSVNASDWYAVLKNTGTINTGGTLIWSDYFENSGDLIAFPFGSSILLQSQLALMTNGSLFTTGDISLSSGDLLISNVVASAGAAISLSVTNALDDGSLTCNSADNVTNKNNWFASNGFNLTNRPASGSLLATTVNETGPAFRAIPHVWGAADLGCSSAGFVNNSAVGQIILDGETQSRFDFIGATANNAIYIDHLELRNWATNQDINGNFIGIRIAPNMKVYFANATANGVFIASKLDGQNGGRFCWVKDYNCGFYSSTNMVYPDGSTNRVNTALAQDCNTDSDADGIVNCIDPSPIPPTGTGCPCNPPIVTYPLTSPGTNGPGSGGTNGGGGTSSSTLPKLGFPGGSSGGTAGDLTSVTAYNGLFYETNGVSAASSGYFTASISPAKTFAAKVLTSGKTYAVSGRFNTSGQATARISRGGTLRALTLQLQLDPSGGDQIRGTITDGTWTANLLADRAGFSKSHKISDQPSTYTLAIPGTANPAGHGFGTVKIGTDGSVQFSGSLGDGTKLTQKSALSAEGVWPLYVPLYGGSGALLSWIQITNNSGLNGDMIWIKAGSAAAKYYPSGFTNQVVASGVPYHAPARGSRVLDLNGGEGQLLLYGAGLSGAATNQFRLELNNRVTDLSGNKLTLSITPSSGLFHGSVSNPTTGKPLQFQGALFENWNSGFGYFLSPSQSGQVYLGPTP